MLCLLSFPFFNAAPVTAWREKAEVFGVWRRGSSPDGEVLSVQGDLICLLCLSAAFVSAPDDLMPESFPQGPDEEQQQRAVYSLLS